VQATSAWIGTRACLRLFSNIPPLTVRNRVLSSACQQASGQKEMGRIQQAARNLVNRFGDRRQQKKVRPRTAINHVPSSTLLIGLASVAVSSPGSRFVLMRFRIRWLGARLSNTRRVTC
jgi:hypothetical protein